MYCATEADLMHKTVVLALETDLAFLAQGRPGEPDREAVMPERQDVEDQRLDAGSIGSPVTILSWKGLRRS